MAFRPCQGSLQRPLESSNIVLISNLPFFFKTWDFRPHFHTSSLKWVSFQKTRGSGWSILERASFSEFIKKFQKFSEESLETPRRNSLTTNYFSTELRFNYCIKPLRLIKTRKCLPTWEKIKSEPNFLKGWKRWRKSSGLQALNDVGTTLWWFLRVMIWLRLK